MLQSRNKDTTHNTVLHASCLPHSTQQCLTTHTSYSQLLPDHDPPDGMSPPSPCPAASSSLQLETPVLRGVANRQLPSQSTQIIVIPEQGSQPANARSESRRNNRRRGARTRRAKVLLIRQVHYDLHSVSVTWHVLPETGVAGLSIGSCRGPAAPSALTMLIFSVFKTLTDQTVTVELKNDLCITGVLKSVDQFLNIRLDSITVLDEARHPHMMAVKNCFIRGSVVRYVQLPAKAMDTNLLEDATRREAATQTKR